MNVILPLASCAEAEFLSKVRATLPAMRSRAAAADRSGLVPADDIAALIAAGVLWAPLPRRHGGMGLGTEPGGGTTLCELLRLIGSGSLAVGRLIEGHVNAIALISRFGTDSQIARTADWIAAGDLFAIWNTEAPPGVQLRGSMLQGSKLGGSGAGFVRAAVITADQATDYRMLLVRPDPVAVTPTPGLLGMRATQPGKIDFSGYLTSTSDWIGAPGDYMREPDFSGGAWRTLAVQLGGLHALTDELVGQLRARGRDENTQQRARIAEALIARETAGLWVRRCAALVEDEAADPAEQSSYVNLARRAIELAGFELLQLVQRSLGLSALLAGNPVEALVRDLTTYLRQPAMDEALQEAAAYFITRSMPGPMG